MKKKVGIIGASGYTGYELIRILSHHPNVELVVRNSSGWGSRKVKKLYPDFKSNMTFTDYSLKEINKMKLDLLFLAMQQGFAKETAHTFQCKVVDLSRDLRFAANTVYGLPEYFREKIKSANIVANPGCYATAAILAAAPIIKKKLAKQIIFDCKSGYSGAGRTPSYVNEPKNYENNIIAYKITQHQHKSEIEKCLGMQISFTPHVIPVFRGIMCTAHILLNNSKTKIRSIKSLYKKFYAKEPFVKIFEDRLPELHDVQNTNYCIIGGFEMDNNRLVIIATLDNLVKGASGQAVQNMNIMLGFKETEALTRIIHKL